MSCEVTMEWTCALCGQLAEVETWTALTDVGWTLNEVGDGICDSCTARQWPAALRSLDSQHPFAAPSSARRTPDLTAQRSNGATIAGARSRPHLALVK